MSEDQKKVARPNQQDEPADEVEAHRFKHAANEEPAQEGDDEVEAHSHMRKGAPRDA